MTDDEIISFQVSLGMCFNVCYHCIFTVFYDLGILLYSHVNNKSAGQSVHTRSLVRTFVVGLGRCFSGSLCYLKGS